MMWRNCTACATAARKPFEVREVIAGSWTAANSTNSSRSTAPRWCVAFRMSSATGRNPCEQRHLVLRISNKGALSSSCAHSGIPLGSCRILPASFGKKYEAVRDSRTAQIGDRPCPCARAEVHGDHGGSFGAGKLGMCGAPIARDPGDVAERTHLGDGRRAGGGSAGAGQARWPGENPARRGAAKTRKYSRRRSARSRDPGASVLASRGCGTTA